MLQGWGLEGWGLGLAEEGCLEPSRSTVFLSVAGSVAPVVLPLETPTVHCQFGFEKSRVGGPANREDLA